MTSSAKKIDLKNLNLKDVISYIKLFRKQISHRVILLDFRVNILNIALASSSLNGTVNVNKFISVELPNEALDKTVPTDPNLMAELLSELINTNNILSLRTAVVLSSDSAYSRLVDIPSGLNQKEVYEYISNPSSVLQIPITLSNTDFDITPSTDK